MQLVYKMRGPGSVVGIATGYELDSPGIETRWGRDFPHLSRPALGPTQPPVQWVPGFSRGKERPGCDANPSPLYSAVGHERELYLYFPYGSYGLYRATVPVQGCTLPFLPTKFSLIHFFMQQPPVGQGFLNHDVSRSHTTTHHSR
jgi:hypothetical protein